MSTAAPFGLTPAPGETDVTGTHFLETVVMPWMKGTLLVSSMRIAFRDPNTVLGFIPVGVNEQSIPLRNVASVSTNVKFRLGRAVLGLIALVVGFSLFESSPVGALLVLLLALAWLANAVQTTLQVANSGGGVNVVSASIFDKAKLEKFAQDANHRLYADHEALRHQEAIGFSQRSEFLQTQMLQGQMMQNQMMQAQAVQPQAQAVQPQAQVMQQPAPQVMQQPAAQVQPVMQPAAVQEAAPQPQIAPNVAQA